MILEDIKGEEKSVNSVTDFLGCDSTNVGFTVYYNSYGHIILEWSSLSDDSKKVRIYLNPRHSLTVIKFIKSLGDEVEK
jgi:hypothetical protein